MDQFVQSVGTGGTARRRSGPPCDPKTVMDYYDGNTVTGALELRAALRDERQLVRHRRSARRRRARSTSSRATPATSTRRTHGRTTVDGRDVDRAERRRHARRQRRLLAHERRAAVLGRLLDPRRGRPHRHEHRRRAERGRPLLGLVPGRLPADDDASPRRRPRPATPASRRRRSSRTSSRAAFTGKVVPARRVATRRSATRSTRSASRFGATTARRRRQWGFKDDYIAHHEPFEYYASTANPHHLTFRPTASGNDTLAGLSTIGTDTQSYVGYGAAAVRHAEPQLRHERLRPARRGDQRGKLPAVGAARPSRSSRRRATRTATPPTPTRPTSRRSSSTRSTRSMQSPDWSSTAVVVNYDDSDGWYDHVYSGVTNPSLVGRGQPDEHEDREDQRREPDVGQCGPSRRPRRRSPASRAAAASARGCRCSSISPCVAAERRRPQPERPGLDLELHRVQLGPAGDRRLVRPGARGHRRDGGRPVRPRRAVRLLELRAAGGSSSTRSRGRSTSPARRLVGDQQGQDFAERRPLGREADGREAPGRVHRAREPQRRRPPRLERPGRDLAAPT